MIGILTFLLFAGIAVSILFTRTFTEKDKYGDLKVTSWKPVITAVGIFFFGLVVAFIQPFSLERVDAGHVGIKVKLTGDMRGVSNYEYKTGWVILNDWTEKLYEFPTFQQTIEYPEQNVITKGGFSATIHPKFNYSLNAGNIGDMFVNLRLGVKEVEQGWLQTAIVGAVNDVANRWLVDDIFNHREQFEGDIQNEANKRVAKWFKVSQLRTNIIPPKSLQETIIAKTNAIQQAQAAEAQKAVAIAKGETAVAEAKADSAQRVIRAAGEAEEIRRKQATLSREYLDYLKIQKWNGENSKVVTGGGTLLNVNQ